MPRTRRIKQTAPAPSNCREEHTTPDHVVHQTVTKEEQWLIGEFVRYLGYEIVEEAYPDRPDALLTLREGDNTKLIALELTRYFNDTLAGSLSPLTPYEEFWERVQDNLLPLINQREHLTGVQVVVDLRQNLSKPADPIALARKLAEEFVEFLKANPIRQSERRRHQPSDFDAYPTIKSLIAGMRLSRLSFDPPVASRFAWKCNNITCGDVNLSLDYIKSAIANKTKKAGQYNWEKAQEKWLLIAAGRRINSNCAGSPDHDVNWNDSDLLTACQDSPFNRIVFWEMVAGWHKWIEPDHPIVKVR